MKNAKKRISMAIAVLVASFAFAGCSSDGMELANAYTKSQSIYSMESKTNLSFNISATNLTDQEKQMMNTIRPFINDAKITADVKVMQNQDRTSSKVWEDFNAQMGQMPLNMTLWADMDLNSQMPFKEIIKMPGILNSQMPDQFKGKEYLVMSSDDMNNIQGAPVINYKNLIAFTKNYQTNLMSLPGFGENFNPGTTYITKVGTENKYIDNKLQQVKVYELKLTDASLKSLMHYTLNNLADNPDSVNFVRSYVDAVMSIYESNPEIDAMKAEMDKAISSVPQQAAILDKSLDSIKDVKLLGDEGIVIKYYVNKDGYIVYEQGNAQLVVDMPSINKLSQSDNSITGIYTINLNFNTEFSNINELTYIEFPQLNDANSYKYGDLLKSVSEK